MDEEKEPEKEQSNEPVEQSSTEVEKEPEKEQNSEPEEPEKDENNSEPEKSDNEEAPAEKVEPVKEKVILPTIPKKNKEGSFKPLVFVMIISLVIAMFWDRIPFIKDSVHAALDPSAGWLLLNLNITFGMLIIVFIISLLTTIIQKYATDQEALRELRKEQKILQEEMKKYRDHPEKMAELSKKQFAFIPQTFKLTSRAIMFTGIPFILFFRWFSDFFAQEALVSFRFFGFFTWFWFYLIFTMVFSTILRKVLKVV